MVEEIMQVEEVVVLEVRHLVLPVVPEDLVQGLRQLEQLVQSI